jgi:hypothetical protein
MSWRAKAHAYRDWIAPFVKLDDGLLRSAAWGEFWLYAADKNALTRQWLRWAHSFAQRFRKVTPGSPGVTQLATYFVETDVVITAADSGPSRTVIPTHCGQHSGDCGQVSPERKTLNCGSRAMSRGL